MKNVSTKIAYMVIGSLLTVIGYHFGNVDNNSVNAQESFQTRGEIVNTLRVRQIEIVGNDDSPRIYLGTDLDRGQIKFVGDTDTSQISLKATADGGQIQLHNRYGKPKILLDHLEDRGRISILGENEKSRVALSENDDGGIVLVKSEDKKSTAVLYVQEYGPVFIIQSDHGAASLQVQKKYGGSILVQGPHEGEGKAGLYVTDDNGFVHVTGKENYSTTLGADALRVTKSEKTLLYAGDSSDDTGGILVTSKKDGTLTNSIGETSTSTHTYQKRVKTTRSIDFDRYRPVPGSIIR